MNDLFPPVMMRDAFVVQYLSMLRHGQFKSTEEMLGNLCIELWKEKQRLVEEQMKRLQEDMWLPATNPSPVIKRDFINLMEQIRKDCEDSIILKHEWPDGLPLPVLDCMFRIIVINRGDCITRYCFPQSSPMTINEFYKMIGSQPNNEVLKLYDLHTEVIAQKREYIPGKWFDDWEQKEKEGRYSPWETVETFNAQCLLETQPTHSENEVLDCQPIVLEAK